ncbi:MAG: hypothetical protein J6Y36_01595 [Treponema sp.]|nr:hypothetical protein [Treponema sp.]
MKGRLTGKVFIKNLNTQETDTLDLTSFLRNDEKLRETYEAVDEYKEIFVLTINTEIFSGDKESRVVKKNRFLLINPKGGIKTLFELPDEYRFMYPASESEVLVATIDSSKEIYNSAYKKYQTYDNLDKLYLYNIYTNEKKVIFDNQVFEIDFDGTLYDCEFVYDKDSNILLFVEELESKFDEKPSKPQRLRTFNVATNEFKEIDSIRDPDAYSSGYIDIESFKNGIALYQRRTRKWCEVLLKDVVNQKPMPDFAYTLDILGEDKYLVAEEEKSDLKEIFNKIKETFEKQQADILFYRKYNLKIVTCANGSIEKFDTKTQLIDERGDLSTFSKDSIYRTRFMDLYVDEVNQKLFE